jgi:hypothetical protein
LNVHLSGVANYCLIGCKSTTRSLTFVITGMVLSDWLAVCRRQQEWWREVAYAGTKLLYQPAQQPIVYIVLWLTFWADLLSVPYGSDRHDPVIDMVALLPILPDRGTTMSALPLLLSQSVTTLVTFLI